MDTYVILDSQGEIYSKLLISPISNYSDISKSFRIGISYANVKSQEMKLFGDIILLSTFSIGSKHLFAGLLFNENESEKEGEFIQLWVDLDFTKNSKGSLVFFVKLLNPEIIEDLSISEEEFIKLCKEFYKKNGFAYHEDGNCKEVLPPFRAIDTAFNFKEIKKGSSVLVATEMYKNLFPIFLEGNTNTVPRFATFIDGKIKVVPDYYAEVVLFNPSL